MKFLIVLSLVLVSALAYETSSNNNNNNNPSYDNNSNEWDASPRNGGNSVNGRRTPTDVNGLTAESLGDMFQRQSQQRGHQRGQHGPGSMNNNNQQNGNNNGNNDDETSSLGYWASYPDSAAFDAKIKARLSTSRALSDKPEVRRKITQLAEEKFNQCKVLTDDRERACLGRVTGQIMQLVSAVENMARNPQ